MSAAKQVIIIAGPNGAGKTTFARILLAPLKAFKQPIKEAGEALRGSGL